MCGKVIVKFMFLIFHFQFLQNNREKKEHVHNTAIKIVWGTIYLLFIYKNSIIRLHVRRFTMHLPHAMFMLCTKKRVIRSNSYDIKGKDDENLCYGLFYVLLFSFSPFFIFSNPFRDQQLALVCKNFLKKTIIVY